MVHSKLFRTIVAATVIATSTLQTLAVHAAGPTEPMGPIGPAAPNRVYGGGDGGTLELGTWCIEDFPNPADDRWGWCDSARSLKRELVDYGGWVNRYQYSNGSAWEEDWKAAYASGNEATYLDQVDLAYIATHGTTGVWDSGYGRYSSASYYGVGGNAHDDAFMVPGEVYRSWGDWDNEWVAFDSCLVLNANHMGYWANAMNGTHLIMGFDTIMLVTDHGGPFGQRLRWGWTFPQAWLYSAQTAMESGAFWYNRSIRARVLAEEPCQFNDRIGSSCGDFAPNGTYHWLDYTFGRGPLFYSTNLAANRQALRNNADLQLPVLNVVSSLPTDDDLARLAGAFSIPITAPAALDDSDALFRTSANGLDLTVDKQGKYSFANLNELYVVPSTTLALSNRALLPEADVRQTAETFLRQGNLLPSDAMFIEVLTDTVTTAVSTPITPTLPQNASNPSIAKPEMELKIVAESPIAYRVIYGRQITVTAAAGTTNVQTFGPGSRLTVYVSTDNKVVGTTGGWRAVSAASARGPSVGATALSGDQAVALMRQLGDSVNLMPTGFSADVITPTVAGVGYFEQPLGVNQNQIVPVYQMGLDMESSHGSFADNRSAPLADPQLTSTLQSLAYVPAVVEALPPLARIVTPTTASNNIVYGQVLTLTAADSTKMLSELGLGANLTFTMGTAPFTYTWKLQNSGKVIGTGLNVSYQSNLDDFLGLTKSSTDLALVITLQVSDATGKVSNASKTFNFIGDVPSVQKIYSPLISRP